MGWAYSPDGGDTSGKVTTQKIKNRHWGNRGMGCEDGNGLRSHPVVSFGNSCVESW